MKNVLLPLSYICLLSGLLTGSAYPLEIFEPVEVDYSTYLGGSGGDAIGNTNLNGEGGCIAVDATRCAYVIGSTSSTDFPTCNAYQSGELNDDAFISKFDESGSILIYSTYLGGYSADSGEGIAVDDSFCAYLIGSTGSGDFPVVNPYQNTHGGGNSDAFVTKLSSTGSELIYSTYLGGGGSPSPYEYGYGIAVDSLGRAYVTGETYSNSFPTFNAYQPIYGGNGDAFVTKFDSTGSALIYSTYLGGNSDDVGSAIAVDDSFNGCGYVTGDTSSSNFPTRNCIQAAFSGGDDAFITKFDNSGSSLTFSTYLGGSSTDGGNGIAVDTTRAIYIAGGTRSSDFPTMNAYQSTNASPADYDAFITKIASPGSPIIFSTYLGGSDSDQAHGIAVYLDVFPFLTGETDSDDFPVVNAYQPNFANQTGGDAFIVRFSCGGNRLLYSSYLGGNNSDRGMGITIDSKGYAYIGGTTGSDNFPIDNPYQSSREGLTDGFITKLYQSSLSPVYCSGDYNGDGVSDIAIYRPENGLWAIRKVTRTYFGAVSDQPIPGDYNGDGTSDIGIFRSTSGLWAVRGLTRTYFGGSADQPVPSDYNGDTICDIAIFRRTTGLWAVRGITRTYFGSEGDKPVPGDYTGSGSSDVGIFRPESGLWALRGISRIYFGHGDDQITTGDFNGDGVQEIGVFRACVGLWARRGVTRIYYGDCEDQAIIADYNGDGSDDIAIYRPPAGLWGVRGITRAYYGSRDDLGVTR